MALVTAPCTAQHGVSSVREEEKKRGDGGKGVVVVECRHRKGLAGGLAGEWGCFRYKA